MCVPFIYRALLGIEHLERLPGIRWKLTNLERLAKANPKKLKAQARELEALLRKTLDGRPSES